VLLLLLPAAALAAVTRAADIGVLLPFMTIDLLRYCALDARAV
jgi:hypothetical protein